MTTQFSSLYGPAPNANTPAWTYRGPNAERRGDLVLRFAQFTGAIAFNANPALNNVLFIAGGFAEGERIHQIINTRSADPDVGNDFTFNLGFRLGTRTEFAAANTGMQAVAAFEVTPAAAAAIAANVARDGDDLILTPVAGAMEVATVTHTFVVVSYLP